MKKIIIALALSLVMALSMVSCGSGDMTSDNTAGTTAAARDTSDGNGAVSGTTTAA